MGLIEMQGTNCGLEKLLDLKQRQQKSILEDLDKSRAENSELRSMSVHNMTMEQAANISAIDIPKLAITNARRSAGSNVVHEIVEGLDQHEPMLTENDGLYRLQDDIKVIELQN